MSLRSAGQLVAAFLFLAAPAALAQTYPDRPIQLIHGFGPGGNADVIARVLGQSMGEILGKPVVVDGKVGAGGNIASEFVAHAKPDGYTLILLTGGHAVSAGLYKSLRFKPIDDFTMISTVTFFPFVVSVRADHKFKTIGDMLAAARAAPGTINYSSVGIGSTQHLTGELLASMAGVELVHIPYRGGLNPLTDLLSGQIDMMIDTVTVSSPQVQAGKIRGLGVTSPAPWPGLPGVPTVAETVPGFDVRSWLGLAGPAGLPPEILARLNDVVIQALASPAVKDRLTAMGNEVRGSTPEAMRAHVASEVQRWTAVIQSAKVPQQ